MCHDGARFLCALAIIGSISHAQKLKKGEARGAFSVRDWLLEIVSDEGRDDALCLIRFIRSQPRLSSNVKGS